MFKAKVTAKVQNVSDWLSGWYLLNDLTFCRQTSYGNALLWARMPREKCFAVFKVKTTVWAHTIKILLFLLCLQHFATKLSLMEHHHKPECLVKRLDCCAESPGHGDDSTRHWMFVNPIFCVLLIFAHKLNVLMSEITRSSANKLDVCIDSNSDLQYLCTQRWRGVFCHA